MAGALVLHGRHVLVIGLAAAGVGCGRAGFDVGPVAGDCTASDELLRDGFETGGLAAWDGVTSYTDASLAVSTGYAHSGSHSLKSVNNYVAGGWWQNHAYKNFGAPRPVMHVSLHFLARYLPPDTKQLHLASLFGDGLIEDLQFLSIGNDGGSYHLSVFFRSGGVSVEQRWDLPDLVPDEWNAVEMRRVATNPGMASVWWNGQLVINVAGTFSDADNGQLTEVHLGMDARRNDGTDWVQETWIDDVVVSECHAGA